MKPAIESILPYTSRIVTDCVSADKQAINIATESITRNFALLLTDITNSFNTTVTGGAAVPVVPSLDKSFDYIDNRNMQLPCPSTMTGTYLEVCTELNTAATKLSNLQTEVQTMHTFLAGLVSKPERYKSSIPKFNKTADINIDGLTAMFEGKSRATDKISTLFRTEGEITQAIDTFNNAASVITKSGINTIMSTVAKIAEITKVISLDTEKYDFSNASVTVISAELYALGYKVQQLGIVKSLAEDIQTHLYKCVKVMKK